MRTMSKWNELETLNVEAVKLMACDVRGSRSVDLLRKAVGSIPNLVSVADGKGIHRVRTRGRTGRTKRFQGVDNDVRVTKFALGDVPLASSHNTTTTIFNYGFTVELPEKECRVDRESRDCLVATLLYNLALSHHRLAFRFDATIANLKSAFSTYRVVYRIATAYYRRDIATPLLPLLLATLNNLCHIYAHFFDHERTESCRGLIHKVFQESSPHAGGMLDHTDHTFYLSALSLYTPSVFFATAA